LPYLSKRLRRSLETLIPQDWADHLEKLHLLRSEIIEQSRGDEELKQELFESRIKPVVDDLLDEMRQSMMNNNEH
jgi:hypothetical protein